LNSHKIEDLTITLSAYATVSEKATLYEAVLALEAAQENSILPVIPIGPLSSSMPGDMSSARSARRIFSGRWSRNTKP
jgi:hypothetical protein